MTQAGRAIGIRPGTASSWSLLSIMPPLGALRTAPSAARAHARAVLASWQMEGLADDLELVVSELVANAVNASASDDGALRYAEGRMPVIGLCLFTDGTRLVAEVWDQAPGVPVRLSSGRDDERGRGLDLVDTITGSRWGWHPARSGPGKCVWAEFSVTGAAAGDGSQHEAVEHSER
jgi:anti-sigma regulatory factor (Ser/Thr protein kinase)